MLHSQFDCQPFEAINQSPLALSVIGADSTIHRERQRNEKASGNPARHQKCRRDSSDAACLSGIEIECPVTIRFLHHTLPRGLMEKAGLRMMQHEAIPLVLGGRVTRMDLYGRGVRN